MSLFFRSRDNDWGGPTWIRSPVSRKRVREVLRGDLFICYQTVANALSNAPSLHEFTGPEFLDQYQLYAIQFRAEPK